MKPAAIFSVLAIVICLAPGGSLAADRAVGKIPLTITLVGKMNGDVVSGRFSLTGATSAYIDSGVFGHPLPAESWVRKTADGLAYVVIRRTETLKGKHGTLVIRSSVRRFDVVDEDDFVSTGTWSIVRGTGRYAALEGRGALVGITAAATGASNFTEYDFTVRLAGHAAGA
jgi:hypothetical protein